MQRQISGYHLLMILTNVDGKVHAAEDLVVREWLSNHFQERVNLDEEMEAISSLKPADYPLHFHLHMENFYLHSTDQERLGLLQFAMDLIKADGIITPEENRFFDMLYEAWGKESTH